MISETSKIAPSRIPLNSQIWLVLGIIFLASNLRAPITAVGPLVDFIRNDLHISNTLVGMLTTFPLLTFGFFSLFAPRVARRFGTEYVLMLSLVIMLLGSILRSLHSVGALFVGTSLLGIAIAFGNVLIPSLIKRDFPQKVGLVTGVYTVSMNVWATIAAGISVPLAQSFGLGWRGSLLSWTILCIVALAIWVRQLRFRELSWTLQHAPKSGIRLWHSSLAWQVSIFMGIQSLHYYTVVTWLPEILSQHGISHLLAGWMLSLMQFVGLPASFFTPIVASKCSNQRILVGLSSAFLFIGYIGLISGNAQIAPLWVVLIGIAGGANFGLALIFFTLRTQNGQDAAELSGMAQAIGYLIAAIGPSIFGFINDNAQSWTLPLVILAILAILLFIVGFGAGSKGYVTPREKII